MHIPKKLLQCILVLLLNLVLLCSQAQNIPANDTSHINYKRLRTVILTESVLYTSSMVGLYSLWYKDYPLSSFHFFNDNNEWLQMDKLGHATTGYYIGKIGYDLLKWTGVHEKKSIWYGGSLGFVYLTTIEILDGFSEQWGSSHGDLIANAFGSAIFIGQQLKWYEQRVLIKLSFHQTIYAKFRPDVLGSNLRENMIKDYNGHTFWVSINIHSFLSNEKFKFPKWLNIAVGYGADEMTGGSENPAIYKGKPLPTNLRRHRQYYLSADIDLTRVKTSSKPLKVLLNTIGFIKFPLPAFEYSRIDGIRFYPVYF